MKGPRSVIYYLGRAVSVLAAAYGWWGRRLRAPCRQSSGKAAREQSLAARPLAYRARRFSSWRRAWPC
eukprot:scaffold52959_cov59-Phaeocystis_antarctica.AAC.11